MQHEISALLVYDHEELLGALDLKLAEQFIKTVRAKTCQEVVRLLDGVHLPYLVFTDITLPDGTWQDVLDIAVKPREAISVIVVAPFLDIPLYCEAMERGACDFIVPPFLTPGLTHVIACAIEGVVRHRGGHAHAA